jgi:hypothetical protein
MGSSRGGDEEWVAVLVRVFEGRWSEQRYVFLADQPAIAAELHANHRKGLDITRLISFLSREPSLALAFNYASLILNTTFFLEGLVGGWRPPRCILHLTDAPRGYRAQRVKRCRISSLISSSKSLEKPVEWLARDGYGCVETRASACQRAR